MGVPNVLRQIILLLWKNFLLQVRIGWAPSNKHRVKKRLARASERGKLASGGRVKCKSLDEWMYGFTRGVVGQMEVWVYAGGGGLLLSSILKSCRVLRVPVWPWCEDEREQSVGISARACTLVLVHDLRLANLWEEGEGQEIEGMACSE